MGRFANPYKALSISHLPLQKNLVSHWLSTTYGPGPGASP